MRTHYLALLLTIPLTLTPLTRTQAATSACETKAGAMLDALGRKDYVAASHEMGAQLQAAAQQKMLISIWETLIRNNWGPYRSHGAAESVSNGDGSTTIRLPLQFDHGSTTATITCTAKENGAIDEFVLL